MNESGFTLIELILVVVIIMILSSMVVLNVGGRVTEANISKAKGDISTFISAIDLYALDHNDVYPQTLEDLVSGDRRYVREIRDDPWGNPYTYKPPTSAKLADYDVVSAGMDGVPGSGDDVTSISEHE